MRIRYAYQQQLQHRRHHHYQTRLEEIVQLISPTIAGGFLRIILSAQNVHIFFRLISYTI